MCENKVKEVFFMIYSFYGISVLISGTVLTLIGRNSRKIPVLALGMVLMFIGNTLTFLGLAYFFFINPLNLP